MSSLMLQDYLPSFRFLTLSLGTSFLMIACTVPGFAQSGSRHSAPSPSTMPPAFPPVSAPVGSFSSREQSFQPSQGLPAEIGSIQEGQGQSMVAPQIMPQPAQQAQTGSIWEIYDPNSVQVIDHSSLDYFLSRYVRRDKKGLNRVCYRRVTCEDYQVLQGYLRDLQGLDIRTFNRREQLAYWLNLYNAQTVAVVVRHQPKLSIRQIKTKFLDLVGPFDDKVVTVLGQNMTLTEIENDVIRSVFKEPRIHYALNCASVGCPNLQPTAWRAANLEQRLDAAAFDFVNSGRAFKATLLGVKLSSIYKWYADDFGGNDAAVLRHLRRYANSRNRKILCRYDQVMHYFYDWSLNVCGRGSNLYGILLP